MNMQQPQQPKPDQDAKLHITQLHESITEEILWQKFRECGTITNIKVLRDRTSQKSKGCAKITFAKAEQAKMAITDRNLTHLIPQEVTKNKRIIVQKDLTTDKFQELKKSNLYITGIPSDIDPRKVYQYLTKFGEIQSLNINNKKDGTGFGQILFENKADADKLINSPEPCVLNECTLSFSQYVNPGERTVAKNNIYLKDFSEITFTEEQGLEEIKTILEQERQKLEKILAKYGSIQSIICQNDQKHRKPFAFACFKEEEDVTKLIEDHANGNLKNQFANKDLYININKKQTASKANVNEERCLVIKNLKFFEDEAKEADFRKDIEEQFAEYGKITSLQIKKGKKPKDTLPDSNMAIVFYEQVSEAQKFLYNYLQNDKISNLFQGENAHGNVTILIPQAERKRMLRQQHNFKQSQVMTFQQSAAQGQQMKQFQPQGFQNYQKQHMGPMQGQFNQQQQGYNQQFMGKPQGNMVRGGQKSGMQQQRGRQQQGGKPMQQGQIRTQAPQQAPQQTQAAPVQQQAAQQPQQQEQQQGSLSLVDLKKNLERFTKLDVQKQGQILGNLIYPEVRKSILKKNREEALAAKVTGMLIDFTVFEIGDILEFLETEEELDGRVEEAVQLIQKQIEEAAQKQQ